MKKKNILLIGYGAIGLTVKKALDASSTAGISHVLVRPERAQHAQDLVGDDCVLVTDLQALLATQPDIDVVAECAGHSALAQYGPTLLEAGIDVLSLSSGALADNQLQKELAQAAEKGGVQLRLLSGAIGGLDVLSAGSVGGLDQVEYRGIKPVQGWKGSAAENAVDLDNLQESTKHYEGSAREAASRYPKNANVAASVALVSAGLDETHVALIANPAGTANVHEIEASGQFGSIFVRVEGRALPDNPRSSALAAYSMIRALQNRYSPLVVG
ncbi:MAG: aspartate dehydrogenase [Granulosicoccus sp.]|nr:aspartate dehydrogenase [Granulosicoccus sp.]